MKKIQCLIAASALYVLSATAYAEDWYILVAAGTAEAKDFSASTLDSDLVDAGATGLESSVNDSHNGYKFQVGYHVSPNVAIEGGYVDLGNFAYEATFNGGAADADISAWGLNLAGVGILPIGEHWGVFGKLGLIAAQVDTAMSVTSIVGSAREIESASSVEGSFGLGVSYTSAEGVGIRAEWERYLDVGNDDTGESDIEMLTVGLVLAF